MNRASTYALSVLLSASLYQTTSAQTLTTNPETWQGVFITPTATCTGCTINVPAGYTFLLNTAGTCDGCTFTGAGTVDVSAAFKFLNTNTFSNLTVIFDATPGSMKNLAFNNDSIAVNAPLTWTSGPADISNSRIAVNAAIKMPYGNLSGDSIHLNSSITFSSSTDTIQNSNVTMADGSSLSTGNALFSGSVFSLSGTAAISTLKLTSSSDAYYMAGTSTFKNSGSATYTNDIFSLTGSAGFSNTSGFTATGGSISTYNNSTFSISSTFSAINEKLSFNDNSVISVSSNSFIQGGSVVMNGSAAFKESSSMTVQGATINLNGNTSLNVSATLSLGSGSDLTIGDGSGTSSASVSTSNLNVKNNSFVGIPTGSSSLHVSSGSFTNDYGSVGITSTTSGCATFSDAGAKTCVVLAVADMTLSAADAGAGKVELTWTDNAVNGADHFLVQRNSTNNDWSTIATVAAGGYSNGNYRFPDNDAPSGKVDYRIARVDGDGKTTWSPVSAITVGSVNTDATIGIHPNPAVGGTFYVTTPFIGQLIINVYTMTGQLLVHTEGNGQTQYTVHLPSQTVGAGAVVVQTIAQGGTRSFTVLVR